MLENMETETDDRIVARMKVLVAEFISQNSVYEKLDIEIPAAGYKN